MSRSIGWLLGPELFWMLVYSLCWGLARLNIPPTVAGNNWVERVVWILPLLAVPAAFAWSFGLAAPGASRVWLALRLVLDTLVGLKACLYVLIEAIDYQHSRNSGLLGFWILGLLSGILAFGVSATILAVLGWKGRLS